MKYFWFGICVFLGTLNFYHCFEGGFEPVNIVNLMAGLFVLWTGSQTIVKGE